MKKQGGDLRNGYKTVKTEGHVIEKFGIGEHGQQTGSMLAMLAYTHRQRNEKIKGRNNMKDEWKQGKEKIGKKRS
jgi:hypothetical protein